MMPIETIKSNFSNTIVKICVEDVHKLTNKIMCPLYHALDQAIEIMEETLFSYNSVGKCIKGTGVAVCHDDNYDEEVGCEIAFRKAKLNANIKKRNLLRRCYRLYKNALKELISEDEKLTKYINNDMEALKEFNPEYKIKVDTNPLSE